MSFRFFQISLCVLLLCCYGCSGDAGNIATVEGIVTVDGNPIDRATVIFYPAAGRSSNGYTDDSGHYSLVYIKSKGALIGSHKVTITTALERDYDDGATRDAREEMMPERYLDRYKTDLTANVESGDNKIDFNLKSADF